jgi:hypothetical protein
MLMFPWLWIWTPQVHFPWSGSVDQTIEPNSNWFFDSIAPAAGNSQVEKKAFAVASYGRQLGLITDVLVALAEKGSVDSASAADALARLKDIRERIATIKSDEATASRQPLLEQLRRLKTQDPPEFERMIAQLQS